MKMRRLTQLILGANLATGAFLAAQSAQAEAPAQQCAAKPVCVAQSNAIQLASPAAPKDPLEGLFTPTPLFKSIIGDCCTGGRANCPPVPGRRVVGCGNDCGTGQPACLYL